MEALIETTTKKTRYNEGPWDWQKFFAITRFRYIEVLFHIFHCYWGKENNSLYLRSTSLYRVSLYVYHGFHRRTILELIIMVSWCITYFRCHVGGAFRKNVTTTFREQVLQTKISKKKFRNETNWLVSGNALSAASIGFKKRNFVINNYIIILWPWIFLVRVFKDQF